MSESATPEQIAAAWRAWHSRPARQRSLGPGPAFVEAINAALAVAPSGALSTAERRGAERMREAVISAVKGQPGLNGLMRANLFTTVRNLEVE